MGVGRRSFSLYLDLDLRLIHSRRDCPEARFAVKYRTIESLSLQEGDQAAANALGARGKVCPACVKAEAKRPTQQARPPLFRGEAR